MASVMELFSLRPSADQDDRVRRYLLPTKLLLTQGAVSGAEHLLEDHPVQASLERGDVCLLDNRGTDEKAGLLLDFGRELHGNLQLTTAYVHGPRKRVGLLVRFGESVSEALAPIGHKNATNDHAVRDHVYDMGMLTTAQTGDSGFRFAYIRLEDPDAALELQAIHMGFLFRDIPYLGSFRCSDPLLEDIWKTAAYTVHLNMQSYLWDGIKRDRLAWQGDMHTEVMTLLHVFGPHPIVPKTLDFLRDKTEPGCWINGFSSYSLWWIIVQGEWYRYTGDLAYLRSQREFLKAQAAMAAGCVDAQGAERLTQIRFLDWPSSTDEEATHAGLQGLLRLALVEAGMLLELLEEDALARHCTETAGRMKADGLFPGKAKQAAAFLSLAGLGDPEVLDRDILSPGGARGYSTFLGYYILAAKAKAGDIRGALEDLREYWGGMLAMGATSFWEDFDLDWMENAGRIDRLPEEGQKDIHADQGNFCYTGFRHSLCHGWASGPVPFLMRHILGITPLEPGCRKLQICPRLDSLTWAEGTFPTPLGCITVRHTRLEDGTVQTRYTAPEGVEIILA